MWRCGGPGGGRDGNRCVERDARGRRAGPRRPGMVGRLRRGPEDAAFRRGAAGGLCRRLGGRWRSADSEGGGGSAWRRHGIARVLLARVADDARNLGARTSSLEVRAANAGAPSAVCGPRLRGAGPPPRYYSDGEDALIMQGPLPTITLAAVPNGESVADESRRAPLAPPSAARMERLTRSPAMLRIQGRPRSPPTGRAT